MPSRQRDDVIATNDSGRTRQHDQATIRTARKCCDGAIHLLRIEHLDQIQLNAMQGRDGLDGAQLSDGAGVSTFLYNRRSCHVWRYLLEQFDPFRADAKLEHREACGVAARPS